METNEPRLRFDGLYRKESESDGTSYYEYLRFYPEPRRELIHTGTTGEPWEIADWFYPQNPEAWVRGSYRIEGTSFTGFALTRVDHDPDPPTFVHADISGEIVGDELHVTRFIEENGYRETAVYHYVPITPPEPKSEPSQEPVHPQEKPARRGLFGFRKR